MIVPFYQRSIKNVIPLWLFIISFFDRNVRSRSISPSSDWMMYFIYWCRIFKEVCNVSPLSILGHCFDVVSLRWHSDEQVRWPAGKNVKIGWKIWYQTINLHFYPFFLFITYHSDVIYTICYAVPKIQAYTLYVRYSSHEDAALSLPCTLLFRCEQFWHPKSWPINVRNVTCQINLDQRVYVWFCPSAPVLRSIGIHGSQLSKAEARVKSHLYESIHVSSPIYIG